MTKPLRMKVRVQNNRLVRAREDLMLTQTEAARRIGMSNSQLGMLENLKEKAWTENGWRQVALRIAEFYGYSPEYLWPDEIAMVRRNAMSLEIGAAEVASLMPQHVEMELAEMKASIGAALATLSPRDRLVLTKRFGFDDPGAERPTLRELGAGFGVCVERARAIEGRALENMRRTVVVRIKDEPDAVSTPLADLDAAMRRAGV